MTPERWAQAQQLVSDALQRPAEERAQFLRDACDGDPALHAQVQRLLADMEWDDAAMHAVIGEVASALIDHDAAGFTGTQVGAWRIVQRIATGGMGAVYLAERADGQFEQRTALKVLNPALLSADALSRFQSERQILARLEHPNIARLIDGGATQDGIPFLVMEFIDGVAIDAYCREHALDTAAKLRLVQKVCAAIDHAHKSLIVHRDIKPSNILVDRQGEPKLLDFGVAKLIGSDPLQNVPAATVADMRVMTPRYASPEQIKGETITTATDVYSLGVLLYELLVGRFPYRDAEGSAAALHRAICETEPERPSTAATRNTDQSATGVSGARLGRMLEGDLDNIVLMALRKEPARRYASALQLMEDIERYLSDEPVRARPNRWSYRARKFVARHKAGVLGAMGAIALIVAIVAFYTIQLAAERDRAQLEARRAREVGTFLTGLFREADPNLSLGKDVTARVLLERGAERADLELKSSPQIQAALISAIAQSYTHMAEFPTALRHAERALQIVRPLRGEEETREAAQLLRGRLLGELGRYDEAASQLETVHREQVARHGERSLEATTSMRELAHLERVRGNYEAGVERYEVAIGNLRTLGEPARAELARTLDDYAGVAREMSRMNEAESALRDALSIKQQVFGEAHPETVSSYGSLGNLHLAKGDSRAAIDALRRALDLARGIFGADSLRVARIQANLGNAEYYAGQYEQSERDGEAALAVFRRVLGEDHPHVAFLTDNIANAVMEQGRLEEALRIYQQNVAKLQRIFGADHVEVGRSLVNSAGALIELGRHQQAIDALEQAQPIFRKAFGDEQIEVLRIEGKLAEAEAGLGRYPAAEKRYRMYIEAIRELHAEAPNSDEARAWANLGELLRKSGHSADAEESLRRSLAVWGEVGELDENREAITARAELGRTLLASNRAREAIIELAAARDWFSSRVNSQDVVLQGITADLAAAQRMLEGGSPASQDSRELTR